MAEIRHGIRPAMEADIAVGSLAGVPPSSIADSLVIVWDDQGQIHVAGAGVGYAKGRQRLVRLLAEAMTVLDRDGLP